MSMAQRMKIGEPRPVDRVAGVARKTAYDQAAASAGGDAAPTRDVASIMGIPEYEFTPRVRAAMTRLMEEVDSLRQELEVTRQRITYLERLADQDTLAPVINRRAFVRELSRMMSYVERYGTPHSVLFFDINNMKEINDSHGHAAGDAALIHVASVLVEEVRESDIVGRLGGDEFGVILAQADEAVAKEKAATLAEVVASTPFVWQNVLVRVTVSHGAHTLKGGDDADSALNAADQAMYRQKKEAASAAG